MWDNGETVLRPNTVEDDNDELAMLTEFEPAATPMRAATSDLDFNATVLGVGSLPEAARPSTRNIPQALASTDVVPEFRSELKLTRLAGGGYEVTDPSTGRVSALNDLEISFARMLNGRRRVYEILEATERLGIPVNLASLQKFVVQLEQNGFLVGSAPVATAGAENKTWATRGSWESGVRSMFQSGIRQLRLGKYAEAAGYFEAMLQADPDNIEAVELLAMAEQARDGKAVAQTAIAAMMPPMSTTAPMIAQQPTMIAQQPTMMAQQAMMMPPQQLLLTPPPMMAPSQSQLMAAQPAMVAPPWMVAPARRSRLPMFVLLVVLPLFLSTIGRI